MKFLQFLILSFGLFCALLTNSNIVSIDITSKKLSLISIVSGALLTYAGWRMCSNEVCDRQTRQWRQNIDFSSNYKFLLFAGIVSMLGGAYSLSK